jgi:Deoxynucleoside kinase
MQRLIERSVFSDRMVFVRAVHNAKWMSELELQVYDSWFNPIVSALPTVRMREYYLPWDLLHATCYPDMQLAQHCRTNVRTCFAGGS